MAMTRRPVAETASSKSSLLRQRWVMSVLLTFLMLRSPRLALATASAAAAAAAAAAPAGKVTFTSPETRKEFCQFDSFEARCDNGEAIVMETAQYGRMRSGRCISGEGYIGCSANVMVYMDGQCSGRRHCLVAVASLADIVQPCRRDFTSYLEATYSCHKVAGDGAARCSSHDRPVQLVAETGTIFGAELLLEQELTGLGSGGHILGSSAAATLSSSGHHQHGAVGISSGPGDNELQLRHRRCSWQVRSSRGQRVVFKLSVYRPGRYPDSSSSSTSGHRLEQIDLQPSSAVHVASSDGSCPWSLSIEDGDTTVTRETLCSRTGTIATGIHLGSGGRTGSGRSMTTSGQIECQPMAIGHLCTVHLDWPTGSASRNLDEEDLPIFALQYEVLGCPDVDPGNGAIVDRRDRDELVVRCPDSKETWYLTCGPDNRWIGEMFNCSTRVVAGPHKAQGTSMSFPHGLIAAIVLGLIFGLVIGTASLGALYVYRRSRKLPTSSSRHPGTTDIDDVIGMSSDDYGSEKLRLDTPHLLHHHHLHFRPLTPSPAAAGAGTDCWRLQTFDYSHHVSDSTRSTAPTTTLDLLSAPAAAGQGSDLSSSGHQPIYCPSVGPATLTSGSMVRFAGSAVADTSDYETSSSGPPVVFSRCGRPNCSATAAGRVVGTYETPRFLLQNPTAVAVEPPLNATLAGRSAVPPSAAESKVYFELLDSGRRRAGHTTGGLNTTTIN